MKEFKNIVSSKKARLAVGIIGAVVLALLIFHAGVVFGSHRNSFGSPSGRSGMSRGFRPPFLPSGFELPHGFIPNRHGAVGAITAITLPTLTMETREGMSKTIMVSTSTMIRNMGGVDTKTLSVGDKIIVLGGPDNQGRIDAKLIRILSVAASTP
jgi:hypothetical protein